MPNVPEIPDIRSNRIETPRVEVPVIRNLEPPPILVPINRTLPIPVVDVPLDGIPQYEPIDAPTSEEFRRMINPQQEPKKEEEIQDKPRALPDLKGIGAEGSIRSATTVAVAPPKECPERISFLSFSNDS